MDTDGIEFSSIASGTVGVGIKYRILINSVEFQSSNEFQEPPLNISAIIPLDYLNIGDNLVRLEIDSEDSANVFFEYPIAKEDTGTPVFHRQFDFKEDYMSNENIAVTYGEGLLVVGSWDAELEIEIPTASRSNIKSIGITEPIDGISIIPTMLSNIQDGFEASASSVYNVTYSAWKAFNGLNAIDADAWVSSSTSWVAPQWLQVKLPYPQHVEEYRLRGPVTANQAPRSWRFEGSKDGLVWDTLDIRIDIPIPVTNVWEAYEIKTPGSYLYYRILIVEKHGTANYVRVAELRLISSKLQYSSITEFDEEMLYIQDLGAGKLYTSRLLTEYESIQRLEVTPI
jgi:hypothetical protein